MRIVRLALAALAVAGCGPSGGTVALVLDIPNAMLDPKGFSNVEVRMLDVDGSTTVRNVAVVGGEFDLGEIDATTGVMIEAVLRTDSGAAVGYGRAAQPADFRDGARIVIPVRRPIIYLAGLVSYDADGDASTMDDTVWEKAQPTFSDLATSTVLDGSTKLADTGVLTVSAGPNLYVFDQMPESVTGELGGTPTVKSVSTGDHAVGDPLAVTLDGGVLDAAGSDDGRLLLVGTTTQLFVINTELATARPVATGRFDRVAIVSAVDGTLAAVAIKNRELGACMAELVWIAVNDDDTNHVMVLGTGGFSDVAGDAGRAFFVDACSGELGEATASGTQVLRGELANPTALAVSNGQAWIGLERASTDSAPAGMALVSAALAGTDPPRTLFDEPATQVVEALDYPGVQRELDAETVSFLQLEVGAGGDYVAATLAARFEGEAVFEANFPRMEIESQELRVIAAATGAPVQRYRSWCDGLLYIVTLTQILDWNCATSPGQMAAVFPHDHRIHSMTFQYGKK